MLPVRSLVRRSLILPLVVASSVSAVHAQSSKYHITAAEQAACFSDAARLCSDSYPDEDKLLSCMKQNQSVLSEGCATAFKAGLRRRHMS